MQQMLQAFAQTDDGESSSGSGEWESVDGGGMDDDEGEDGGDAGPGGAQVRASCCSTKRLLQAPVVALPPCLHTFVVHLTPHAWGYNRCATKVLPVAFSNPKPLLHETTTAPNHYRPEPPLP